MSINTRVMTNLAFSIVSIALLTTCADLANPRSRGITGAVQWASTCTLLSSAVYILWGIYKEYQPRNVRSSVSYDEPTEAPNGLEEMEESVEVQATVVLYPELTLTSVWVYVYGWGLLLFVSLYCLSGIESVSTCWWILGMTSLVADDLINSRIGIVWTSALISGLSICSTILWFLEYNNDIIVTDQLVNFLLGVFSPTICPFIFFSLRNTAHTTNVKDISRLFGLAMPFMVVLALCSCAGFAAGTHDGMAGPSPSRRDYVGYRGTHTLDKMAQLRLLKKIKHNNTKGAGAHFQGQSSVTVEPHVTSLQTHVTPVQTHVTPVQTHTTSSQAPNQTAQANGASIQASMQTPYQAPKQTPMQTLQNQRQIPRQTPRPATDTTIPAQPLGTPPFNTQSISALGVTCFLLSPLATLLVLRQLIYSVMEGFTTEFVNALLLVMTVRHWTTDPNSAWAILGVALNGLCFVLILCIRG